MFGSRLHKLWQSIPHSNAPIFIPWNLTVQLNSFAHTMTSTEQCNAGTFSLTTERLPKIWNSRKCCFIASSMNNGLFYQVISKGTSLWCQNHCFCFLAVRYNIITCLIRIHNLTNLCFVDCASRYNSCKWPTWRTILFFVYVYSKSLHVSSTHVLIIRRINCINTTSGICYSM